MQPFYNNPTMIDPKTTALFIVDGKVDYEKINTFYEQLKTIAEREGHVNILVEVRKLAGFENFVAIFKDLKTKWFVLRHLRKCSIVTYSEMLEEIAEMTDFLTPGIAIKTFEYDEMQNAVDWIDFPTREERHGLAIKDMYSYLHLVVYDRLTKSDYRLLEKTLDRYDSKISVLLEFADYEGISPKAFWEDLKLGFKGLEKFKNIAVVNDKNLKTILEVANFITPNTELKLFRYTEIKEAITWLKK